jgi:hypothetical protein
MNDKIIHKIKGYLGYDVLCSITLDDNPDITYPPSYLDVEYKNIWEASKEITSLIFPNVKSVKLHLRPLEDLTDEELIDICYQICEFEDEYKNQGRKRYLFIIKYSYNNNEIDYNTIEHFHKNQIDYQDLIGQGLAIKKEIKQ